MRHSFSPSCLPYPFIKVSFLLGALTEEEIEQVSFTFAFNPSESCSRSRQWWKTATKSLRPLGRNKDSIVERHSHTRISQHCQAMNETIFRVWKEQHALIIAMFIMYTKNNVGFVHVKDVFLFVKNIKKWSLQEKWQYFIQNVNSDTWNVNRSLTSWWHAGSGSRSRESERHCY